MVITEAIKYSMQKSSTNVPERVTSRGSNALRLKLVDGKQVMLLNNKGVPTGYGKHWYGEVKKETEMLKEGFDPNTKIIRRSKTNSDYIKLNNGQEAVVRTWRTVKGGYHYTELGKEFFAKTPRRYILSIPTLVFRNTDVDTGLMDNPDWMAEVLSMRHWKGWYNANKLGPLIQKILGDGIQGGDANKIKELVLRQLANQRKLDVERVKER